jgi:hypothetical protein
LETYQPPSTRAITGSYYLNNQLDSYACGYISKLSYPSLTIPKHRILEEFALMLQADFSQEIRAESTRWPLCLILVLGAGFLAVIAQSQPSSDTRMIWRAASLLLASLVQCRTLGDTVIVGFPDYAGVGREGEDSLDGLSVILSDNIAGNSWKVLT